MRTSSIKGVKRVTASLLVAGLVSVLTVGVAIAHGTVDQSNPLLPPTPSRYTGITTAWVLGQTFIPQESNIISVDLIGFSQPEKSITVSIRESSEFSGNILGSVTQTELLETGITVHFDFLETIPLVAGNTYLIEVSTTEVGGIRIMRSDNVSSYSGGIAKYLVSGVTTEHPEYDIGFTTYYEPNYNKNDIKKDGGNPGKGMDKAPGLHKQYSENSNSADNVVRKNKK